MKRTSSRRAKVRKRIKGLGPKKKRKEGKKQSKEKTGPKRPVTLQPFFQSS